MPFTKETASIHGAKGGKNGSRKGIPNGLSKQSVQLLDHFLSYFKEPLGAYLALFVVLRNVELPDLLLPEEQKKLLDLSAWTISAYVDFTQWRYTKDGHYAEARKSTTRLFGGSRLERLYTHMNVLIREFDSLPKHIKDEAVKLDPTDPEVLNDCMYQYVDSL